MSDRIDRAFADLTDPTDRTYPGSNQIRKAVADKERRPGLFRDWDLNPIVLRVGGVATPLYDIKHLALAVGVSPNTIRTWEKRGYFPKPDLQHPTVTGRGHRRLYTREQVEGIACIAREEHIVLSDPPRRITHTNFEQRVRSLFLGGQSS